MRRIGFVLLFYFLGSLVSCCTGQQTLTEIYIQSTRSQVFSFDEFGNFPSAGEINPEELGVSVSPDSTTMRVVSNAVLSTSAYACEDPNQVVYATLINSLNITTLYDFDSAHPAGSNIHDLLLQLNILGNTREVEINELSSSTHYFKFTKRPDIDSLSLVISGKISDTINFIDTTELVNFL